MTPVPRARASARGFRRLAWRLVTHATYLPVFWVVFFLVHVLTAVSRLLHLSCLAALLRRLFCRRPRLLYLAAFFPGNAGFEERAQAWAKRLAAAGFDVRVRWCLSAEQFQRLLAGRQVIRLQLTILFKRLWQCLAALGFDGVVVQRELLVYSDYGGTFAERFLLALNPRVALDFDDDIAAAKHEPRSLTPFGRLMFESGNKFRDSLRVYPRFLPGSAYLEGLIQQARGGLPFQAIVVPTCIELDEYRMKDYRQAQADRISFGWIGGVGNLYCLDLVVPALAVIAREHPIRLIVISGRAFQAPVPFEILNVPWSRASQASDLLRLDIGLMPLPDGPVERGKCGFKLLQYMACGIVSVASAVTTNLEIVDDGIDGFLVRSDRDWPSTLRRVIGQRGRFEEIGRRAIAKVVTRYSLDAHQGRYLAFVRELCGVAPR